MLENHRWAYKYCKHFTYHSEEDQVYLYKIGLIIGPQNEKFGEKPSQTGLELIIMVPGSEAYHHGHLYIQISLWKFANEQNKTKIMY